MHKAFLLSEAPLFFSIILPDSCFSDFLFLNLFCLIKFKIISEYGLYVFPALSFVLLAYYVGNASEHHKNQLSPRQQR